MAQSITYKGITFDSKIEFEMYLFLESENFTFTYQPVFHVSESVHKDTKIPLLTFQGIQGKKVTPDFAIEINDVIIILDTKGFYRKTVVINGKKKEIKNRFADYVKYKYENLRRYFYNRCEYHYVIFIVDEYNIGKFKTELLLFRKKLINLNQITNQY
jgi:hypothetical protein